MFSPNDLLDLKETPHASIFEDLERVWEALPRIAEYLQKNLKSANHGQMLGQCFVGDHVYIGAGTTIEPGALIKGPAWIGENCEIRAGAYVRENVIAGHGCVLGNSCEFKNSILFNGCQVPHFSYVGDSVLGARAHLGAGSILSNLKLNNDLVSIHHQGRVWPTGLRKFGAILGDGTEIGCNAVVNPGSILGRRCLLYPGVVWRGVLEEDSVVKLMSTHQIVQRHSRSREKSSTAVA